MSLKVAVTLLVAELVVQSCALFYDGLPVFSYASEKNAHHKLSINATRGYFWMDHRMCNASAWSVLPGDDSAITQDTSFPLTHSVYHDVDVINGDVRADTISLVAHLNTTTYKLSLTAEKNDSCQLATRLHSPTMDIHLEVVPDEARKALTPAVLEEIKPVLSEVLAGALPTFLMDMHPRPLQRIVKDDALCKQILAAKPESFPQPNIMDEICDLD